MADQWETILNAVGTVVDGVSTATVVVRKSGETLPSDTYPMWLVCAAGEEQEVDSAFTSLSNWVYPVAALYISAHNRAFGLSSTVLGERWTVRELLNKCGLAGVSSVIQVTVNLLPITTYEEAPNTTFDVTGVLAQVSQWETRTNA